MPVKPLAPAPHLDAYESRTPHLVHKVEGAGEAGGGVPSGGGNPAAGATLGATPPLWGRRRV